MYEYFTFLVPPVSCKPDQAGEFVLREDWKLKGKNIKKKRGISLEDCKDFCLGFDGCASFDYDPKKKKCYLQRVKSSDKGVKMVRKEKKIYGEKCPGMYIL